ncbi:GGDEF domain-containing protein [Alkanindiges sp. WGS2144]|uniref:GGDEF domain-containing protein n=1 Tax=Alkanindiges sp. WGS2144 TaxID=3366808 RepID=UPI00375277A0
MDKHPSKTTFILNWSPLNKSLLMLSMGILIHATWLVWKLYVYWHPGLWPFVNTSTLKYYILINMAALPILVLVMLLCWWMRSFNNAQVILPYLCVLTYGLSMVHEAYIVGIMSPATSLTLVVSVIIGLLLFRRLLVYSTLTIILLIFSWIMYKTIQGNLPYAPIFIDIISSDSSRATVFWAFTMLWLVLPILIGGVFLLEVLLSQWRQREKNIRELSRIDPLTGLYNRRTLYDFLTLLQRRQTSTPQLHSLILLDLDFFKKINDTHGHIVGDKILVEAAKVLKATIRKQDIVGRFGGEEFIIVLTNINPQQTRQIAERCRNGLMTINIYNDQHEHIEVTASFGITYFDNQLTSIDEALKQADQALYQAKASGRNQVVHYQENTTHHI